MFVHTFERQSKWFAFEILSRKNSNFVNLCSAVQYIYELLEIGNCFEGPYQYRCKRLGQEKNLLIEAISCFAIMDDFHYMLSSIPLDIQAGFWSLLY